MATRDDIAALQAHYELGREHERLDSRGGLELARTKELIDRVLPPTPATIADIGGGPGRYTRWLAERGYTVIHRDVVPLHVEQTRAIAPHTLVDSALGDARHLDDIADRSVDVALLLGPLYHLTKRPDRVDALREARRITRPGGVVLVAAISRWAMRLDGILNRQIHRAFPEALTVVDDVERDGWVRPLIDYSFTGYSHTPALLRREVKGAGLALESLVSIEGAAQLLSDLEARAEDPAEWQVVLDTVRATEAVPELLGVGAHLLVTARRP